MAPDSFWDVLARRLRETRSPSCWVGPVHGPAVRQTWDPGLRFVLLGGGLRPGASLVAEDPRVSCTPSAKASRPALRRRPTPPCRLLTEAQRSALERLRSAGASDLTERFTADELRRAYRRLALRWHPDRHPAATSDERDDLAQTFTRVTAAYRQLADEVRAAA